MVMELLSFNSPVWVLCLIALMKSPAHSMANPVKGPLMLLSNMRSSVPAICDLQPVTGNGTPSTQHIWSAPEHTKDICYRTTEDSMHSKSVRVFFTMTHCLWKPQLCPIKFIICCKSISLRSYNSLWHTVCDCAAYSNAFVTQVK